MRERAIEDRLRGRLTGPTGEADFLRHAADDLEWAMDLLGKMHKATIDASDDPPEEYEDSPEALEKVLKETREHREKIDELETELEQAKASLAEEQEAHKVTRHELRGAHLDALREASEFDGSLEEDAEKDAAE